MKNLVARLLACVFVGSFCIVGPLLLVVALGSALQRAALIYSGLSAQGTVIAKRQIGSTRVTYAPVFQFTASDGRTYVVNSDVSGRESAFRFGQRVRVLYRHDHPESARIDAFAPLWTFPLVVGVVGAGFSVIPTLMWVNWKRRRLDSSSLKESRALVTSLGVLLTTCGVLVGQWVPVGSRLYHALGGAAITSMAAVFAWVAQVFRTGIAIHFRRRPRPLSPGAQKARSEAGADGIVSPDVAATAPVSPDREHGTSVRPSMIPSNDLNIDSSL